MGVVKGATGQGAYAVTPGDDTVQPFVALYVGTTGDVAIRPLLGGNTVTFVAVPAGTILPVAGDRVLDTGTDAEDIVAITY